MRKLARTVLLFTLVLAIAGSATAQEKKKTRKKRGRRGRRTQVVRLPRSVTATLTDEQKPKLQAINKEYAPKMAAIRKKQADVLTAEQKETLAKAGEGKRGRERATALRAARKSLSLTAEQKKQQKAIAKELSSLQAEINKKVDSVLTDEQKELRKKASKRKGGKKRKKKAAA
jgi:Spy/CpxP family protein refolding chaperone